MPCANPRCASLEAGHDVADRPDTRDRRAQRGVDRDEAALEAHACVGQPELVGDRAASDRHQQEVGVQRIAVLHLNGHAVLATVHAGDADAGADVDAALAPGPLECGTAGGILGREQPVECLEDRHVDAHRRPHARELHADHTRRRGRSP